MPAIDEATVDHIRHRQKIRDVMKGYGLTEIVDYVYSAGDVRNAKMAVVAVCVPVGASEDDIKKACHVANETYRNTVTE